MVRKQKTEYWIQSVSKALSVLEQFHGTQDELRITDLSLLLHSSRNYILRLLATLEFHGYVEKNLKTGGYRLGLTTLRLGQAYIRSRHLAAEGHQILKELSAKTHETVFSAYLREGSVICADVVESTLPVRVVSPQGTRIPLHCTAAGKLMLAFCDGKVGAHLKAEDLRQQCEGTITSSKLLMTQLEEIRKKGYALDREECEAGLCGVAAPIRDFSSRVIAVVSIVGPSFRFEPKRVSEELAPLVIEGARNISRRLGFRPAEKDATNRERSPGQRKSATPSGLGGLVHDRFVRKPVIDKVILPLIRNEAA